MNNNFSELENMVYSGRGITIGMTPDGKPFIGYSLTGRSPSSQARKLEYDKNLKKISIGVTNEELLKTGNVSLLVYPAIEFIEDKPAKIIASNGRQTVALSQWAYSEERLNPMHLLVKMIDNKVFDNGIDVTQYEPDSPNFTPRISGCIDNKTGAFYVVKKKSDSDKSDPALFPFELMPGQGRIVTTYRGGNENPLMPFNYVSPLSAQITSNTAQDICESIYAAIGPKGDVNYRVAAAVMILKGKKDLDVAIINRFDRGN